MLRSNSSASLRRSKSRASLLLAVVVAIVAVWFAQPDEEPTNQADIPAASNQARGSAFEALTNLPVKEPGSAAGYDRAEFGPEWTDNADVEWGHNGCDTRSDLVRISLQDLVVKEGTQGCVPLSGTLLDPYTGEQMSFERGQDSASLIHVDHLVSLSDAWQSGAQHLSTAQRRDLANDPLNLWAVSGSENMSKGDRNAAEWLPSYLPSRCPMVAAQIAVKAKYRLSINTEEAEAMHRVLRECPDLQLPAESESYLPRLVP